MPKLTVFESKDILTKKFWKDGSKENPTFSNGTFDVVEVGSHSELAELIKGLASNQALCCSIPFGYTEGTIVTKENEDEENNVISRSKKYFNYPSDKGWLFIDVDEKDITEVEVIDRLTELYPPFGTTSYVYATSASHGIGDKKGYHLYFKVDNISNVKPAMDNLFNKAFNAGYGYCKVDEIGRRHNRTFFDKTVFDRARLDFISGPVCVDFDAPQRDIRVVPEENDSLDLTLISTC